MDAKVSAPTRLEEILAEWEQDKDLTQTQGHGPVFGLYKPGQDSITVNGALNNVSITSPYTVTTATSFPNAIWTTNGTTTAPWLSNNPTGARIQLDGESADITVNGWSLVDAVKRIEERLGLYQPNPELEKEWEDLHALAEQYRKLEQHIRDKQDTFDRLKAMPKPDPWPG